ncbi:MAG TPA: hypothetical protein VJT78_12875 [Candidatus Dormibacteraeota bacterium]|nr:hypothetical protein [Candidatus Dormibacteraeota bacterium]
MRDQSQVASGFLERMTDPGFRLHGEDPANVTPEQARRWATRYESLIKLKLELLKLCERYAGQSEPEVASAIRETDMILLETQISRFQQKSDYWKIRSTELSGIGRRGVAH